MKRLTSLCLSLLLVLGLSAFTFTACSQPKENADDYPLIYESTDGGIKITGYNEQTLPEDVVIPEKIGDKAVVSIGQYAFFECDKIKSLTIDGQSTQMELGAFYRCRQLKKVVLPEKLKKISDYCFSACSALTDIKIPNSVEEIGEYAFSGCPFGEIKLPSSLKIIKDNAFAACQYLKTAIPDNVTLGNYVFINPSSEVPTSLNSFTFTNKITPGNYDFGESTLYVPFFPDSSPSKKMNDNNTVIYTFFGCNMGYDDGAPYVISAPLVEIKSPLYSFPIEDKPFFKKKVFPIQPPSRYGYKFWGWSTTEGAQKPDFEKLCCKDVEQPTLHTVFYYIDKKTKQEVNVPIGSTLYAVWQKKDEDGSVLIPLE